MKKILYISLVIVIIICAFINRGKIKRAVYEITTEDYLEIPQWVFEVEKNMTATEQQIVIDDYCIKMVGVAEANRKEGGNEHYGYLCKFEITNPVLDLKECVKPEDGVKSANKPDKVFGISDSDEYIAIEESGLANLLEENEANGSEYNTEYYYKLEDEKLFIYVYVSISNPKGHLLRGIYICDNVSIYEGHSNSRYLKDMDGVFSFDVLGNKKQYTYNSRGKWNIEVTDYNIYINGDASEEIEQFIIYKSDKSKIDLTNICLNFDEPQNREKIKDGAIYDMGTYEPDEYVKTYTRLIHFMAGTDVENIDHLEINGQILK